MSKIIVVSWRDGPQQSDRHFLVSAEIERERELAVLDRSDLRTFRQLEINLPLYVGQRNFSSSSSVSIEPVISEDRSESIFKPISGNQIPFVTDGKADNRVRTAGNDHITRHIGHTEQDAEFPLIRLVQCHNQPERTAQHQEEQKNQKLLADYSRQEVSEDAECMKRPSFSHQMPCSFTCL